MKQDRPLATFRALSDPVRLEILDRIAEGKGRTATSLASSMPITRQAITRHVRTLEDAGLIVGTKRGREHRYRVDRSPLAEASRWLETRTASWGRTLARLANHLESDGS